MWAVVQWVKGAMGCVGGKLKGAIDKGLLVYIGVQKGDTGEDLEYMASKLRGLRVFQAIGGKRNLDVKDAGGSLLVVSQFTLLGDARKGRRPSFDMAEDPGAATGLYEGLIEALRSKGIETEEGEFQAHMEVESINDGPVTILLDSRKVF